MLEGLVLSFDDNEEDAISRLLTKYGHAYDTCVRNGKGARIVAKGQRFEGRLDRSEPNGNGAMTYPDGSIYMWVVRLWVR